ncbi:MAG: hypothetical protein GXP49_11040, partial [Deltaproteobacteria bacterium]|nr:hypothetical protein [Deltaproteobacteria bacterium]
TVEAHLIGFDGGDLYGRNIKLEFYHYVRGIQKFDGPGALRKRIEKDIQEVLDALAGVSM